MPVLAAGVRGQTGARNGNRMPVTWADHLGIARAVASIEDYSVGEAARLMAVGLHLLQRDLVWRTFGDEIALIPERI